MQRKHTTKPFGLIILLILSLALQGCNRKFLGFNFHRDDVLVQEIDYDYLSTRTKFKYKNGDDKTKATARMRIKKDSLIWFSLTPGVGIEAARGRITKDSLILVDRINKEYYAFSFAELSAQYNFQFSYNLFQSVLIGDLPIPRRKGDQVVKKGNNQVIVQTEGPLKINNTIGPKTARLENLYASTSESLNTLEIKYGEFKPLNEKAFANKALMILTYFTEGKKQQATVDIEHNRVQIEDSSLSFPFSIPDRYTLHK